MSINIAVLGTASDVGKSLCATALCRIFHDMGLNVAPFKAQNMSNNSFVSLDQGELARAQAVQAHAACIEPSVHMNPILLKPLNNTTSQIIVHGKVLENKSARDYFVDTKFFKEKAFSSLDYLNSHFDMVILEGAGSCAEINLRACDFTNFEAAHHANAHVILVADIDRGGVFAQVCGTLDLLGKKDLSRVKGIIINRFRGDIELFKDGVDFIEKKTNLPVLGVIPFFSDIHIDSEDGLPLDAVVDPQKALEKKLINIAVLLLPHISNFTDFFPLNISQLSCLHFLRKPRNLSGYDLLLIPGSKNVRSDLNWLHHSGWSAEILRFRKKGGSIGGICGGYQMLGEKIHDPNAIESSAGETLGLSLLPIETTLDKNKQLHRIEGECLNTRQIIQGYEIHHGITKKTKKCHSFIKIISQNSIVINREDGAMSDDNKVWGCYVHGLFDLPHFRFSFLQSLTNKKINWSEITSQPNQSSERDNYHKLAHHFRSHLDMRKLKNIAGISS
ncbi:MAG: cobyric acid synthase [Myxococcales bacterium]|nr:cobyric acid synthase [Myxococcales bacterium]USN49858.1 MAG: cobyric acid synthase [Myxococcales bacterium]